MTDSNINGSFCADFNATDEIIKKIDVLSENLKNEILTAKDQISVSGTAYYVAENGNDNNDGLSPQSPIKTIAKVNSLNLVPNDGVFFKRGDIFRGNIGGKCGVTYAAYGDPNTRKPRIYGSPENGSGAEKWSLLNGTNNIWIYHQKMRDVGVIIFNDGEKYSVKKIPSFVNGKYVCRYNRDVEFDVKKHLEHNLDHFCRQDKVITANGFPDINNAQNLAEVYLRCDNGNPGEVFNSIEFATKPSIISVRQNNVHIDNLAIMYGGAHGIGAGTVKDLHVTNCEIGWIGGSIQGYINTPERKGEVFRFGNGIEVYGGCDDYVCNHNYIYQCYDAGVTHQLSAGGDRDCKQKNVKYINNLIEYCIYSFEYFLGKADNERSVRFQQNILAKDNIMRFAGFGFGEQRPSPDHYFPAAHVKGWDHYNYLDENFVLENNIFDRSRNMLIHCCAEKPEWLPEFKNNTYIQYFQTEHSTFGRYNKIAPSTDMPFDQNIREVMDKMDFDKNGKIYFARRDNLWNLPDFLPKHSRD